MVSRSCVSTMVLLLTLALLATLGTAAPTSAQVRWERGQNVAPVFEGWERNPDGTIDMVFGYMNRNYEEMPHIPVGPHNFFEPGPADRGQPSRFYAPEAAVRLQGSGCGRLGRQGPGLDAHPPGAHRQGVRVAVAGMGNGRRRAQ